MTTRKRRASSHGRRQFWRHEKLPTEEWEANIAQNLLGLLLDHFIEEATGAAAVAPAAQGEKKKERGT